MRAGPGSDSIVTFEQEFAEHAPDEKHLAVGEGALRGEAIELFELARAEVLANARVASLIEVLDETIRDDLIRAVWHQGSSPFRCGYGSMLWAMSARVNPST